MKLDTAEISSIIKDKIKGFEVSAADANVGRIVSVGDGVALIHGLSGAMAGEMLEMPGGITAMVLNLEEESVGAVILGEFTSLSEGDEVKCTGKVFEVPVGPELKGRVVNALGQPIDGKGPIKTTQTDAVEKIAPGVIERKSV
ncbi:MAG: F0F1 ATP synthase subunit alpha, partial [Mariprofundaceae bacterium]